MRDRSAEGSTIDGTNEGTEARDDIASPDDRTAARPSGQSGGDGSDPVVAWAAWGRSAPHMPLGIGVSIENLLASQSRAALWVQAILLVGAVAAVDFATGLDLNFSIFYLVPVIFATWFISRRAGVTASILSVIAWIYVDSLSGVRYASALVPAWNVGVRLGFFALVLALISMMKESKAREAALARTDSLTGVANGRSFSDRASLELATMQRTGRPMTVAYIDLDDFKAVNDTRGHTEGDQLLVAVAHAIAGRLRSTDMVARLGGDEFGILLPGTDRFTAPGVLEAIEDAVRYAVDTRWRVGCTIGAVTFEEAPESVDFMVRASDRLMYDGKKMGRGRVEHAVWPAREDVVV